MTRRLALRLSSWLAALLLAALTVCASATSTSVETPSSFHGLKAVWRFSLSGDIPTGAPVTTSSFPNRFGISPMECSDDTCFFAMSLGVPREATAEEKKMIADSARYMPGMPSYPTQATASASVVFAVRRDTGERLWTNKDVASGVDDLRLLPEDRVIVSSDTPLGFTVGSWLTTVINAKTGATLWKRDDLERPLLPALDAPELLSVRRSADGKEAHLEALDVASGKTAASEVISPDFQTLFSVDGKPFISAMSGGDTYAIERTEKGFHFRRLPFKVDDVYPSHRMSTLLSSFRSDCVVTESFFEQDYSFSCVDFQSGKTVWKVNKKRMDYDVEAEFGYATLRPQGVDARAFRVIRIKDGSDAWSLPLKSAPDSVPLGDTIAVLGAIENPNGPSPSYAMFFRALTGELVALAPAAGFVRGVSDPSYDSFQGDLLPAPGGFLLLDKNDRTLTYYEITPEPGLKLPTFVAALPGETLEKGSGFFEHPAWSASYGDLGLKPLPEFEYRLATLTCAETDCLLDFNLSETSPYPVWPQRKAGRFGRPYPPSGGSSMGYWPYVSSKPETWVALDPKTGKALWTTDNLAPRGTEVEPVDDHSFLVAWRERIPPFDPKAIPGQTLVDHVAIVDAATGTVVRQLITRSGGVFLPYERAPSVFFVDATYAGDPATPKYYLWGYRLADGALYGNLPLADSKVTLFSVDRQPYLYETSTEKLYRLSLNESEGLVAAPEPRTLTQGPFGWMAWRSFWFSGDCVRVRSGPLVIPAAASAGTEKPKIQCMDWKTGALSDDRPQPARFGVTRVPPTSRPSPYRLAIKDEWHEGPERGATYEVTDATGLVVWKEMLKNAIVYGPFGSMLIYSTEGKPKETKTGEHSTRIWSPAVLHLVDLGLGKLVDVYEADKDRHSVRFYEASGGVIADLSDSLAFYPIP